MNKVVMHTHPSRMQKPATKLQRVSLLVPWLLLLMITPAQAQTNVVAPVVLGDDHEQAGRLQDLLQQHLLQQGFTLRSASEIADKLRDPTRKATSEGDAQIRTQIRSIMESVQAAYYEDRLADVEMMLKAAEALETSITLKQADDRIEPLLWRIATAVAKGLNRKARNLAKRALQMDPDLQVDLSVFRPSVKRFVEDVRNNMGRRHLIKLVVNPADATIRVDGFRNTANELRLFAGEHTIAAEADGFYHASMKIEVPNTTKARLTLPLELPKPLEQKLTQLVWQNEDSNATTQSPLEKIMQDIDVGCVVVFALRQTPKPSYRAVLSCQHAPNPLQTSPVYVADDGPAAALQWIEESLRIETLAIPKISITKTRSQASAWQFVPRIALIGGKRSNKLKGDGGASFSSSFSGMGVNLGLAVTRNLLLLEVDARWLSYRMTSVLTELTEGEEVPLHGGQNLAARIGAGVSHRFSVFAQDQLQVGTSVGVLWEAYIAEDLVLAGERLGIMPSYDRFGLDVRVAVDWGLLDLGRAGRLGIGVASSIVPFSSWTQTPRNASGTATDPQLAYTWEAGLQLDGSWGASLTYAMEKRRVSFSGAAGAPYDPPLNAARLKEQLQSLRLALHYKF